MFFTFSDVANDTKVFSYNNNTALSYACSSFLNQATNKWW